MRDSSVSPEQAQREMQAVAQTASSSLITSTSSARNLPQGPLGKLSAVSHGSDAAPAWVMGIYALGRHALPG